VEEISGFVGQAAELQIQTQNKLDALADDIKYMNDSWDTRMNQLGDRIDRISSNLEASQQTGSELTRLVTVLVGKVAA
jgi:septal ring factor EnvC (AmiA/AmiB activator)